MKAILKILLVLFAIQSYGQEIIPIENMIGHLDLSREDKPYYKDVNGVLNKFLGTWKYETSTELFEITFRKIEKYGRVDYYKDRLTSRYRYIKNGVVIYDTTSPIQAADSYPDHNVFGGIIKNTDLNKIKLQFDEPEISFAGSNYLELTYNPVTQKLKWYVSAAMEPNENGVLVYPYKTPYLMTLTKVN
ncbi:DUF6705 family protein [Aquimarina sp. 2201CG14-23]|uniref:DUF6705 family protein n=1 Tax=Aquimarina mycalae TaxID=3040073 RepID=UPI0024780679|nr:DUF6705 family protein [Aquimarina sp. 2201CG14-23]MDH7446344.1 hypothetical protein [Aquimarina sp. 2201CG14-23]